MQIHIVIQDGWPLAAFKENEAAMAYVAGKQAVERDKAKGKEHAENTGHPFSIVAVKLL